MIIEQKNLRYKCSFCGAIFKRASECAKHIEDKSVLGTIFPSDIIIVDISQDNEEKKLNLFGSGKPTWE